MKVDDYLRDSGASIFYDPDFRATLEAHLEYLKNHPDTTTITLDPMIVYRYEFDMDGLMNHYGIPHYMHWITLRLNDLHSTTMFPEDLAELKIPNNKTLNIIRQIYQTQR